MCAGSLWVVNEMGLLAAAEGHTTPPPPPAGAPLGWDEERWPTLKDGFQIDPADDGRAPAQRMWAKARAALKVAAELGSGSLSDEVGWTAGFRQIVRVLDLIA